MKTSRRNGLTLIELAAVLTAMGVGALAVSSAHNSLSEEARAAKCLSNLQRGMNAVLQYATEWDGVLPGPAHPMVFRQSNSPDSGPTARHKSLSWYLGPYIAPDARGTTDPSIPNPIVDELFRCPTATMISPDDVFVGVNCSATPKFNYVCNSFGPVSATSSVSRMEANHTDPPFYFGIWSLCASNPVGTASRAFWPKRLDSIRNTSDEWAIGDAWYRRIALEGSRGGSNVKQWYGTFAVEIDNYFAAIPSAPFHRTNIKIAKSHRSQNSATLPAIEFEGETNLAYMDGHVAPFVGSWTGPGNGGTVNPYFELFGGDHTIFEPWYP